MTDYDYIFLDMDGVCTMFAEAAVEACGQPNLVPKQYAIEEALRLTPEQFWEHIDARGEDYWVNLRPYPWFLGLYSAMLRQGGKVFVTSTPSLARWSASGKIKWLRTHLNDTYNGHIFLADKSVLAGPRRVLVDDNERSCLAFRAAGGEAVIFPQPWNSAKPESFKDPWELESAIAAQAQEGGP